VLLFFGIVLPTIWLVAPNPAGGPRIKLGPGELDFGSQDVLAGSDLRTVTITNDGSAPLIVRDISLNGASAADFAIEHEDCSHSPVAPGASCSITLSFTPTTAGNRTAAAQIASNATGATRPISLTASRTSSHITYNPH